MEVQPVDPRDVEWDIDRPAYRVYFFDTTDGGFVSDEYEITAASDVDQVLAWARSEARGRPFVAYVMYQGGESLGAIRLAGADPTEVPTA